MRRTPYRQINMGGGDESLAGFSITPDKEKVLAINVQKESQVPYGVLMVLDQELNPMAISFESDYASHINDLIISGDSLFLSIDFDRFRVIQDLKKFSIPNTTQPH